MICRCFAGCAKGGPPKNDSTFVIFYPDLSLHVYNSVVLQPSGKLIAVAERHTRTTLLRKLVMRKQHVQNSQAERGAYHLYKLLALQLKLDSRMTVQSARRSLLNCGHCFWNLTSKKVFLDLLPKLNILFVLQQTLTTQLFNHQKDELMSLHMPCTK